MHVYKIKQKAIDLRKEGYSYTYISKLTGIAKSTLSDWLSELAFIPNQYALDTIGKALAASGAKKHLIKVDSLEKAKSQAEKDIGNLSNRDIKMLGLGIYIGEGSKTEGITRIINSDPKIIKFVLKWLRVSFGVETSQIKIRLFLYPDSNEKECIEYWSKYIKIPETQFFKSTIDRRTNKKPLNHGKLPYGTAHVTVNGMGNKDQGRFLHRRIMAWIDRVLC